MARWPKPAEGSWTEHYPELGTDPVSYEDCISPEFYALEREAIFKRSWLEVGRVEQLPRNGSYFTRELAVAGTSIVVVRDGGGQVRAFHNICRHRGNKLVWSDFPRDETRGPRFGHRDCNDGDPRGRERWRGMGRAAGCRRIASPSSGASTCRSCPSRPTPTASCARCC